MNSNVGEGKVVCVTGASGYIASWLVKFLLLRGYTVKGTVRDPNDPRKVDHLLKLDGAKERLHLIKADLLEEGSFDQAVEGCEGVFHTASPCFFDPVDPQTEIIDPAVKGTLNVLKSCAKSPNVKRVVLTSSTAAVVFNGNPLTADTAVDETWFSSPDICRDIKRWYNLGKTLAEEAAWKFAKENGIDLVALNPAFVVGPLLQPLLNESSAIIFNLVKGWKSLPIISVATATKMFQPGFFHKRHARKSGVTAECTYSCHRCLDGIRVNSNSKRRKLDPKQGNIQSQKGQKAPSVGRGRPAKQKGGKKPLSKRRQGKSQTNKTVPPSIPLRRSARKAKCLYVQKKRNVGRKKGKKSKSKKVTLRKPKETTSRSKETVTFERMKRTQVCNSYWFNGLKLSTKPNDERAMLFKEKKHLAPSEGSSGTFDQPKCHLCCGDGGTLDYIACEICGEWFHGDAFGLILENVRQLIGFRCHVCRDRIAPICPHKNSNALTHAENKAATGVLRNYLILFHFSH